jgi:hypothetical protein
MRRMNRLAAGTALVAITTAGCEAPHFDGHAPFVHMSESASSQDAHALALQLGRRVVRQMKSGELQPGTIPLDTQLTTQIGHITMGVTRPRGLVNPESAGYGYSSLGSQGQASVNMSLISRPDVVGRAQAGALHDGDINSITVERVVVSPANITQTMIDIGEDNGSTDKWHADYRQDGKSQSNPEVAAQVILDELFLPQGQGQGQGQGR